jgi:hypothetical protein
MKRFKMPSLLLLVIFQDKPYTISLPFAGVVYFYGIVTF